VWFCESKDADANTVMVYDTLRACSVIASRYGLRLWYIVPRIRTFHIFEVVHAVLEKRQRILRSRHAALQHLKPHRKSSTSATCKIGMPGVTIINIRISLGTVQYEVCLMVDIDGLMV
jgi:hypothetical protein